MPRVGLGRQRHGSGAQHGRLASTHIAIYTKAQNGWRQKQQSHHRASREILLTNDQLENIGGHHVEVATDDFGNAKISHDQSKTDQGSRNQTVLGARQSDGEKLSL